MSENIRPRNIRLHNKKRRMRVCSGKPMQEGDNMKRLSEKTKKIYSVLSKTFSVAFVVAIVTLSILCFTIEKIEAGSLHIALNVLLIIWCAMFLIKPLFEDVLFRKSFHAVPDRDDGSDAEETTEEAEQGEALP